MTDTGASRVLGIPRETVREWRRSQPGAPPGNAWNQDCPICSSTIGLDGESYAYLLGLYLGDGWLAEHRRGVFKLGISLDERQPMIVEECARAIAAAAPGKRIGRQKGRGCVIVWAYWKHWPCLFPQHGRGRKHSRHIGLVPWQQSITKAAPDRLLRGLIHADGCRVNNLVGGRNYARYLFSNRSKDIMGIFCRACDDFGISWTQPSFKHISVARSADVAKLDQVVGPKR